MDYSNFRLTTERLVLVATGESHADDIYREFTDEITEYTVPVTPSAMDDVLAFLRQAAANTAAGTEIQVAILLQDTNEFIGHGGLDDIQTAAPELGIWIKKPAHGHRYGREAVTALALWARDNLAFDYLSYPVDRRNIASRTIPESLGGRVEREYTWTRTDGKVLDLLDYHIYPESLSAR